MEMNKKLRGQKHHYNKARYQNKAKVISKTTEKDISNKNKEVVVTKDQIETPERGLKSNWHRYEESSDEEKIDDSTNFALLAQAPISHGGHFQFKSDKNVVSEFDFETLRKNKMFALDLYLLEGGLSTIPFHERCGLDESYFTGEQLMKIDERARQNKAQFESYLKISSITKEFKIHSVSDNDIKKNQQSPNTLLSTKEQACFNETESTKAPEEKSDCIFNQTVQTTVKTDDLKQDKEELEEWLDDLLND